MSSSAPIVDRIRIIPKPAEFLDRNVGSSGELFFSRDSNSLRVYSGRDRGGFEVARADLENISNSDFAAKAAAAGISAGSGASISVSENPPTGPENGNLWLSTENGYLYVYVNDGNSSQWIQPAVPPAPIPSLSTVAFTGNYNDLTNKPVIGESGFSGSYNDLSDKPNLDALATKASPTFTGTLISSGISAFGTGLTQAILDSTPSGAVAVNVKGYMALTEGAILFYKPSGFENAVPFGTALWTIGKTNFNDDFAIINQNTALEALRIDPATNASTFYGPVSVGGLTTLQQSTEVLNTKTNATGIVEHDCSTGAIFYHTNIDAGFTANFTNVPTTNNRSFSVVLVLNQGATPRIPVIQINGITQAVKWPNGNAHSGASNSVDLLSFTFFRVGSAWNVIGSGTTYE